MSKNQHLTRSVAITEAAYRSLQKTSQLTGLSLGTLTSLAIEKHLDPKQNPQIAEVIESAKRNLVSAISN